MWPVLLWDDKAAVLRNGSVTDVSVMVVSAPGECLRSDSVAWVVEYSRLAYRMFVGSVCILSDGAAGEVAGPVEDHGLAVSVPGCSVGASGDVVRSEWVMCSSDDVPVWPGVDDGGPYDVVEGMSPMCLCDAMDNLMFLGITMSAVVSCYVGSSVDCVDHSCCVDLVVCIIRGIAVVYFWPVFVVSVDSAVADEVCKGSWLVAVAASDVVGDLSNEVVCVVRWTVLVGIATSLGCLGIMGPVYYPDECMSCVWV